MLTNSKSIWVNEVYETPRDVTSVRDKESLAD